MSGCRGTHNSLFYKREKDRLTHFSQIIVLNPTLISTLKVVKLSPSMLKSENSFIFKWSSLLKYPSRADFEFQLLNFELQFSPGTNSVDDLAGIFCNIAATSNVFLGKENQFYF